MSICAQVREQCEQLGLEVLIHSNYIVRKKGQTIFTADELSKIRDFLDEYQEEP